EEEAEAFYRSKAQESTEAVRDILNALADQESEHFQVLDWLVELIGHPEANLENAEFNKRS
ncbi:MAG: rubrerythrin, partial [Candidatus Zixiibacteriota bacterium]